MLGEMKSRWGALTIHQKEVYSPRTAQEDGGGSVVPFLSLHNSPWTIWTVTHPG